MKRILSNMTGTVFLIQVSEGDYIKKGQEVIILDSMKMTISIKSEVEGRVKEVKVDIGDFVNEGDVLVLIEEGQHA